MAKVTIVLHKDEIMADTMVICHVVGRRLRTSDTANKATDIQSPEEGPDNEIMARAMPLAFDQVKGACARYLSVGRIEDTNSLEDVSGDYVLQLDMPDRWNPSATSRLKGSIHDHIVNYCVYSIFEKTNPEEATVYLEKAATSLDIIKPILELRIGPVRRRLGL